MKSIITLGLLLLGIIDVSGQSSNRMKVIELVLHKDVLLKTHPPLSAAFYGSPFGGACAEPKDKKTKARVISFCDPIPKFQLPRCSVVCRFEEYVQLHSPFKLNIGVGGE